MNWQIKCRYPSDILSCILSQRDAGDAQSFLEPSYDKLISEKKIPGVLDAKKRIQKASATGERVAIFADYDADGVCGGAIIYKALEKYFKEIFVIIPDRKDGYGLNMLAVNELKKKKIDLLVTVDCGIKNVEEIKEAKKSGIDTIVVDHHQLGEDLPDAILVHPHLSDSLKFKHFSGGGVAFFLAKALAQKPGQEKWLLDLVAISSIADMVPLIADNRILTKFGLLVCNKTRNAGLKTLLKAAKIEKVGAYEVGYMIAPRLNAAGRISLPKKSFDLLVGRDKKSLTKEANDLNNLNITRQDMLAKAQQEAITLIKKKNLDKNNVIILRTDYPEGIIGLVSGKVTQSFYKPSLIFTGKSGALKGSARSVPGIDITKLLSLSKKYLKSFGGHEQAAGVSILSKDFTNFRSNIIENASKLDPKLLQKKINVDALIKLAQVDVSLATRLEKLEPFGQGNQKPVFAFENVMVGNIRLIGKNKDHMTFDIMDNGKSIQAIVFCFEDKCIKLDRVKKYDFAFSVNLDLWNGNKKVKLMIEHAKEVK